ncbi:MAG: bifunctional riboflavin kinase/FAD synthetase [Veillonellales bacterium]
MEVLTQMTNISRQYQRIAVALGTFDGVHIGHQRIINRAIEYAKEKNGTSVVFTFSNHPLSVVAPERCPLQIITSEYKEKILGRMGVDVLLSIPFTPQFLKLSPEAFLQLLQDNLQPDYIVVGPNYSFGYKSAGTPELLKTAGKAGHFQVEIHPPVYAKKNLVSSTLIRQLAADGDVFQAAGLLGRPLRIQGNVVSGNQRGGGLLGYPTANLAIAPGMVVPADGVYAVAVFYDQHSFNGVANIGSNPTFAGTERRIEVHLLNFAGNLYGSTISLDFFARLRGEKTFSSAAALKQQIHNDVAAARQILGKSKYS